jgi:hypothetical protein
MVKDKKSGFRMELQAPLFGLKWKLFGKTPYRKCHPWFNHTSNLCHRPSELQEVYAHRLINNQYLKVVRLSALCTSRLHNQEIFLVFISVRD